MENNSEDEEERREERQMDGGRRQKVRRFVVIIINRHRFCVFRFCLCDEDVEKSSVLSKLVCSLCVSSSFR